MKCPGDEIIQLFIDDELGGNDRKQLESHVLTCNKCADRISEQRDFALRTREAIRSLDYDLSEIPAFGQSKKRRRVSTKTLNKFLFPLAAASIVLLFLLLPKDRSGDELAEIIILSNVGLEIDANLPLSDQEIELVFYNENGEIWNE